MRSILITFLTLCFSVAVSQKSSRSIKSFSIISCESGAIYKFKDNQFLLESDWESKDGSYQTILKTSIADSDLNKLKNVLSLLISYPGNELLLNNCIDDGFNFKIYLYSDTLEKKIFVGNYYDERVDQLTALFESYLLKSCINTFGYHIAYGSKASIEELKKSQESCTGKLPDEYKKHLLDNWCELPKK